MRILLFLSALSLAATASAQERVLLPVFADADGAFGSRFVSELRIYNQRAYPIEVEGVRSACENDCGDLRMVLRPLGVTQDFEREGSPGRVVLQPSNEALHYSLRVRDLSRQAESNGVEIPVVSEKEHRRRVLLLGVDLDERFRSRLRIYSAIGSTTVGFAVRREDDDQLVFHRQPETIHMPDMYSPAYMEIPLPVSPGRHTVIVEVLDFHVPAAPVWAFVSTTNNQTQEIKVVTPQRVGPDLGIE